MTAYVRRADELLATEGGAGAGLAVRAGVDSVDPFGAVLAGQRHTVYHRLAASGAVRQVTTPAGEPAWLVTGLRQGATFVGRWTAGEGGVADHRDHRAARPRPGAGVDIPHVAVRSAQSH